MSDLGGRNFHVMTIGLNLTFIGEEIYTLSRCVPPRDPACPFVSLCVFHIHTTYQSGILGLGGEQGQRGENVQFPEIFPELK